MNYYNLTIHQRISLKGLFHSEKERLDIGIKNSKALDCMKGIMLLWGFKKAIEYYLTEDIGLLNIP